MQIGDGELVATGRRQDALGDQFVERQYFVNQRVRSGVGLGNIQEIFD
ncbi:unannotated protein [freshwater metagenome]|uniref:Unannotated protein n=1 Tax=freshwater metagenome TaxID=449393 RepID=A0A6J6VM18_9ZZZZ